MVQVYDTMNEKRPPEGSLFSTQPEISGWRCTSLLQSQNAFR